jgi:hypothetical protein
LVRAETRVGDEVWVLLGGRTPFVLRRKAGESAVLEQRREPKSLFTMSEACYVYGFMDGEAMGPGKKEAVCLV